MNSDGSIYKIKKELSVDLVAIIYVSQYIDVRGVYSNSGIDGLVSELAGTLLFLTKESLKERIHPYIEYCISDNTLIYIKEILLNKIECYTLGGGLHTLSGERSIERGLSELQEVIRHYKASVKREALMRVAGIEEQDCLVDNKRRAM